MDSQHFWGESSNNTDCAYSSLNILPIYFFVFVAKKNKLILISSFMWLYFPTSASLIVFLLQLSLTMSHCWSSCSTIQEHGAWRVVSTLQALLSSGPGETTEGRLAQEAAEHHEKLAAALVRSEDRGSVLLQRPG